MKAAIQHATWPLEIYKVLKEAGINIKSAKFWQGGFDVIAGMIDELEKIEG